MTWDFTRRDFLKGIGAGAAGLAVAEGAAKGVSALFPPEGSWTPGVEQYVTSVCAQCTGACGIVVRIVDGKAVKIDGNPLHPINRGTLCPKGEAGLQALYNPDRNRGPLRRAGERGSGKWQRITWEEGLSTLAGKLKEIGTQGRPQTLAGISGAGDGLMHELWKRFFTAFGSPNLITVSSVNDTGLTAAGYVTQGVREEISYDLQQAKFILSFSSSFLEDWPAPIWAIRSFGILRRGTPGRRGKVVQVESRLSMTGANADEWIPIVPGSEAALALGLAHVMIREGLYNKGFVEDHTFGFDSWKDKDGRSHKGFKDHVLEGYDPDSVARLTGVQVETIIRLAREFASQEPAVALGGKGSSIMGTSLHTQMAIHSLNALAGSIDSPGGTLTRKPIPLKAFPPFSPDPVARRGVSSPRIDGAGGSLQPLARDILQAIPGRILKGDPYPVNALILFRSDPLSVAPDRQSFVKALEKVPFIVSLSPVMDDSSQYADLILPEPTYLERWEDEQSPPGFPYPLVGVRQPVVDPLYETMPSGNVIIETAKGLGFSEVFPWKDFQDVVKESSQGLFTSGTGAVFEVTFEEAWVRLLEQWGLRPPSPPSFDEFWEQMKQKGGWWDPLYNHGEWSRVLRTKSGRFDFFSEKLRDILEGIAGEESSKRGTPFQLELEEVLKAQGISARGDAVYLPHHEPPQNVGEQGQYPFVLIPYEPMALAGMRCDNQPFLLETLGPHLYEKWESWLEINPESARELNIKDGDMVRLESPVGKITVRARFYKGIVPGVLAIPLGLGRRANGRYAKGVGVNPLDIVANVTEPLTGIFASGLTRVKVVRA